MYSNKQAVVLSTDGNLLSDKLLQAQNLLSRVERAADSVGLQINDSKPNSWPTTSKKISLWSPRQGATWNKSKTSSNLARGLMNLKKKNQDPQRPLPGKHATKCAHSGSALRDSLKISFFRAAVESILLYGTEGWTITNKLEARLDGCYIRLVVMVLDLNWKDHPTREEIYGNLPKVS